jgi:beta-galactosidase
MGNGPGGLSEYEELFDTYERCLGGFVWEWIDHGIRQVEPDGTVWYAYGGDFGEPLHDGHFVIDGLVFPDRTPSPGLVEYKKVSEPVRISFDLSQETVGHETGRQSTIVITSRRDHADTADLTFTWFAEKDGLPVAGGTLDVPPIAARHSSRVPVPFVPPSDTGEIWLTVRALLAGDAPWADAGHEVAWAQTQVASGHRAHRGAGNGGAPTSTGDGMLQLGPGVFDPDTGNLLCVGRLPVDAPRLELWRAPTDNDTTSDSDSDGHEWRRIGLHRLRHRLIEVRSDDAGLVVRSHVGTAATDFGFRATYRWTGAGDCLSLTMDVEPVGGDWPVTLGRVGVVLTVPATLGTVEWFGRGPGEAYRDTCAAARVGRFRYPVDELQTPYVYPQENGNRMDVRWATLTDHRGEGIRIDGHPTFDLTARRWTNADLDAAQHTTDLRPRDRVYINLDAAHQGIGSASCGPGVLPQHQLHASRFTLQVSFAPILPS